MVIPSNRHLFLIASAHNDVGHHGVYATNALLSERYWWPNMPTDIKWYIQTCHICQIRNTQQSLIPPVVAMPAPLFSKVYMDTMYMPTSARYRYITQGRCSLISWLEWAMLQKETGKSLGNWILQDIIYRWGLIHEIVTDNGPAFLKAFTYLEKHYHIKHIRISGYNS
jgi:Integrase zinc binding domain